MKNKTYLYMAPSKPPKIDKDDFGIKRRIMKTYEKQRNNIQRIQKKYF